METAAANRSGSGIGSSRSAALRNGHLSCKNSPLNRRLPSFPSANHSSSSGVAAVRRWGPKCLSQLLARKKRKKRKTLEKLAMLCSEACMCMCMS